jgi:Rieske Fe-S protein
MTNFRVTRRAFLSSVGQGACVAAIISPIAGVTAFAGKKSMTPVTIDLTKPDYEALTRTGGALKIPNPLDKKRPIIVTRVSETEITAYSSKCTHLGCEVPLPVDGVITCPCHKAQFDFAGMVTRGPAKKPLPRFEAVLEGTTITISGPKGKK